ncbi:hypothetical protein QFZ99_003923 [Paraburkholderia atlantica]
MRIDEARHDQLVAPLHDLRAWCEPRSERRIRVRRDDAAVFDDQQTVLVEHRGVRRVRRIAVKGQQRRTECHLCRLRGMSRFSHGKAVSEC